ncbi:MAG: ATP-grasp domain-containing protein [Spirochaetaceae bacterium]|nr:MAG: ATP-grasp domain-containing protein [Spirochaetaceae bacterium]
MKRTRHILILGAGVMQQPALQLARQQGWHVVAADGNPKAAARGLADRFVNIDLRDREALAAFAREYQAESGLDAVFTAGTDFSTSVAFIAEALGLPGIDYQTALQATDKQRMRTLFMQKGIPSVRFRVLRRVPPRHEAETIAEQVGFPVVVKPVDNMGARGVRCVHSGADLSAAVEAALQFSASGTVLVEEFIDGAEFSIDAVIWRGRVSVCGVADRDIRFAPFFIEVGHCMPSELHEHAQRQLTAVFTRAVAALGIRNGAAKGDVFMSRRGPVIGEIAARLSGGYMSGWTYPLSSGAEPTLAAMQVAMGEAPQALAPRWHKVSVERAVISIPGVIRTLHGFEAAERVPNVRAVFRRCHAGETVVFPRNNVEKCGNVISCADTRDAAFEAALTGIRAIEVDLIPGDRQTIEFLFGADSEPAVAAYPSLLSIAEDYRGDLNELFRTAADGGSGVLTAVDNSERDWNGRTLQATLAALQPAARTIELDSLQLQRRFQALILRAVGKGGLQGGRFLFDTIKEIPEWRERLPG